MEGGPEVQLRAAAPEQAEGDVVRALTDRLERMMDYESTRLQLDDMPTVRTTKLRLILANL